ncbi:MAG: efflux RND transporter periplasmic adaptor subunit [Flavobacteriales bacterium]
MSINPRSPKSSLLFTIALSFFMGACTSNGKKNEEVKPFELSAKMKKNTQFESARMDTVQNELVFFGKISADNNKMIEVFPVVGGNVVKVFVELGDHVQKNQLLATIRSTEVASFEMELEDAKNDLAVAKNNVKVTQELFNGRLCSEREVLLAKSNLDKAQSQLNRVQETYQIYHIKKGAIFEVRAPISGFIIQKNINADMLLRSDKTDNIFDIAEISDVWAIANVNEVDIAKVQLNQKASVSTISYPDENFQGKVDKIYNMIDEETKAMQVRIVLPNMGYKLKPEMRATIKLSYAEPIQLITIPATAIVFDRSKTFVMIEHKGKISTREISVYRQTGDFAYIKSGLNVGDRVMTTNQLLIYDALND